MRDALSHRGPDDGGLWMLGEGEEKKILTTACHAEAMRRREGTEEEGRKEFLQKGAKDAKGSLGGELLEGRARRPAAPVGGEGEGDRMICRQNDYGEGNGVEEEEVLTTEDTEDTEGRKEGRELNSRFAQGNKGNEGEEAAHELREWARIGEGEGGFLQKGAKDAKGSLGGELLEGGAWRSDAPVGGEEEGDRMICRQKDNRKGNGVEEEEVLTTACHAEAMRRREGAEKEERKRVSQGHVEEVRQISGFRSQQSALQTHPPLSLGLAHARLSILDLSPAGHQPMSNEDGSVWIAYNGEFYNFQEYRAELEGRGHVFRSHTDTETIIHLYEEYGIEETLRRINGMFAFALWDGNKGELHLVRDRMGQKPLYFAMRSGDGLWVKGEGKENVSKTQLITHHSSPITQLIFGSEIKAILASGVDVDTSTDPQAVDEFWTYGYCMEGRTQYRGIRQLMPGTRMVVKAEEGAHEWHEWARMGEEFLQKGAKGAKDGLGQELGVKSDGEDGSDRLQMAKGLRSKVYGLKSENFRYYDIQFNAQAKARSTESYVDELEELLTDAIRLRLISDVPLGCFLSGGIDSSLMAALAKNNLGVALDTYTIAFNSSAHDESKFAKDVAKHLGLPNRVLVVDENLAKHFEEIATQYDEPFGDISSIPTWFLCKLARQYTTVAITGDGGDELFAGYDDYEEALRLAGFLQKDEKSAKKKKELPTNGHEWTRMFKKGKEILGVWYYRRMDPLLAHSLRGRRINDRLAKKLYTQEFLKTINRKGTVKSRAYRPAQKLPIRLPAGGPAQAGAHSGFATLRPDRSCNSWAAILDPLQTADLHTFMVDDVLAKVDRMSMAHALECRSPFMDHRVVEFASRLPAELRIGEDGRGKWILRELLARHVPRELFERPKQGFVPPWEDWAGGEVGRRMREEWMKMDDLMVKKEAAKWLFPEEGNNPVLSWNGYAYLKNRPTNHTNGHE